MAGASDARAQQPSGFVGGFSLGGGVLGVDGATGGDSIVKDGDRVPVTGLGVYVGRMLYEKTAGMFVVTGVIRDVGDVAEAVEFDVFGGALQHWLAPNVWVRGGVGYGFLDPTTVEFNINGPDIGWLAGAGVDVWRRGNFAAAVEFHLTAAWGDRFRFYAPTVQLGFNWY